MYYLQSRYYNPSLGRFINADQYPSTGQGLLGNNMFAYCLNNPVFYSDPTGAWSWVGAVLGGITSAVGSIMSGGTMWDVVAETAIGFVGGGCTSVVGSLICVLIDSAYTVVTVDASDPVFLSLLVSIFAEQITGDNLNWLLKGALDSDTINLFDWVFGTGVDLVVSGIDVLLQEVYTNDDKIDPPNDPSTTLPTTPPVPEPGFNPGGGSNGRGMVGHDGAPWFVRMY